MIIDESGRINKEHEEALLQSIKQSIKDMIEHLTKQLYPDCTIEWEDDKEALRKEIAQ